MRGTCPVPLSEITGQGTRRAASGNCQPPRPTNDVIVLERPVHILTSVPTQQPKHAKLEVSMSAQFLTESDIVERTQIKSRNRKETLSSPDEVIFVRLPDVKAVTGLSKSSLYALIRANNFPAPVRLGPRTVAWVRSEVKQWAAERILTSRSAISYPGSKRMPQPAIRETWAASKKWA
jgi:prophage regulatory protein